MIREIKNLLGNKFLKKFEIKVICECNQNYDNEIKIMIMCIYLVCYSEEFKDEFLLFVFIFFYLIIIFFFFSILVLYYFFVLKYFVLKSRIDFRFMYFF